MTLPFKTPAEKADDNDERLLSQYLLKIQVAARQLMKAIRFGMTNFFITILLESSKSWNSDSRAFSGLSCC
jgi:hypothetical protein